MGYVGYVLDLEKKLMTSPRQRLFSNIIARIVVATSEGSNLTRDKFVPRPTRDKFVPRHLSRVRFPRMANRTGPLIYGGEPGESWNFSHSPDTLVGPTSTSTASSRFHSSSCHRVVIA
jgi:hypothetical protein